jgi:hypothetical protein
MNVLVEELKYLELKEPANVIPKPGVESSGATKDDKAPIKSEKWYKMLCSLGPVGTSGPDDTYIDRSPLETASISEMDKVREEKTFCIRSRQRSRPRLLPLLAGNHILGMEVGLQTHVLELSRQPTGIQLWIKGRLNPWLVPQRLPRDLDDIPKVVEKLCSAKEKGYIDLGLIYSLLSFFEVPKGLTDIRMVYDGTTSGLNEVLWAPWFPLPTIDSLLRSVEPGTWMADNDVGEMFLNFVLHESIQALCGVDLSKYLPEEIPSGTKVLWER